MTPYCYRSVSCLLYHSYDGVDTKIVFIHFQSISSQHSPQKGVQKSRGVLLDIKDVSKCLPALLSLSSILFQFHETQPRQLLTITTWVIIKVQ